MDTNQNLNYEGYVMTIESSQNNPAITEAAVNQAADRLIQASCQKHGIAVADLPASAIEDARRTAREMVESDQRNQQNEFFHLYNKEKAARESAEAQLGAVRDGRTARADARTVDSMEQVRDRMGRPTWFQLSEAGKLTALGLDPSTVDKTQLRSLFGAKSDCAYAVDFQKVQPYRYRQLKQAALALNITGK
jgi:hypothetical protein